MNIESNNLKTIKIRNQYTWEKEGKQIITKDKINLTLNLKLFMNY